MATLLTQREAASVLRLSERTIERMRRVGNGPRFVRLANHSVRYRQQDLDAYIAARVVASTSEERTNG
jgi:predicted DNA-binding transcriptional regulator AlpA